jgi:hypothetical protein
MMSMPMERYHFERANKSDLIRVFNQNSCLMAEYREQTGKVSWQRLVSSSGLPWKKGSTSNFRL